MTGNTENSIVLKLSGSIDADNCESVKQELMSELEGKDPDIVILDADKLSYISNAGLRMLLQIMNTYPNISMVNVEPDVYETLETTGFTEMMTIEKAIREISIEGCEVIGEGEDGIVYRVDRETVVKNIQKR